MNHGWEKKRLVDICSILNGFAFKSSEYIQENGIRIIRIANVQDGFVSDEAPRFYPIEKSEIVAKFLLEEDDLLISLTGSVGRVALLPSFMLPAALNQRVACLRQDDILNKRFLFYYLRNQFFVQDCINASTGIAQLNLSTEWLKEYPILLPSKNEQLKIVYELDKLNELIELKRNQLKDLDTLSQSLFYETFGDPITNSKGWERYPLNLLIQPKINIKRASKTFKSKDIIEYVDISAIDRMTKTIKSSTEMKFEDAPSRAQQVLKNGDVLISLVRPNLQNIAVNHIDSTNIVGSSGFCVIRPAQNASNTFLMYLLLTQSVTEYLCKKASGASYPAITEDILRNMQIIAPPIELQNEFAERIDAIEEQKRLIESSIADLETLLASRMDYWFND